MKTIYYSNKDLYLPNSFHLKGEKRSREEWLEILPNTLHEKFSEWFTKVEAK